MKKRGIYWVFSLSYWVFVPLGLFVLYPLMIHTLFGAWSLDHSLEFVLPLSALITLFFYGILVLTETKEVETREVIKKWWKVTRKWDLSIILFTILSVCYIFLLGWDGLGGIFAVMYLLGFMLFSNLLIFILIFFRKFLNKEVFLVPLFSYILFDAVEAINIAAYSGERAKYLFFDFYSSIGGAGALFSLIVLGMCFVASIISVYINKFISRRVSLWISIIFGAISVVYIILIGVFDLRKGYTTTHWSDFVLYFGFVPIAILFYFVHQRKRAEPDSSKTAELTRT